MEPAPAAPTQPQHGDGDDDDDSSSTKLILGSIGKIVIAVDYGHQLNFRSFGLNKDILVIICCGCCIFFAVVLVVVSVIGSLEGNVDEGYDINYFLIFISFSYVNVLYRMHFFISLPTGMDLRPQRVYR